MKKNIFLAIAISSTVLFSCGKTAKTGFDSVETSAHGHLYVENTKVSFGKIKTKDKSNVKCVFKIKNTGSNPVQLHKIDVSCGCMKTSVSSQTIIPDGSADLVVNVNTKNQHGFFNKSIFVNSDADNSLLILRVKGEIQAD